MEGFQKKLICYLVIGWCRKVTEKRLRGNLSWQLAELIFYKSEGDLKSGEV